MKQEKFFYFWDTAGYFNGWKWLVNLYENNLTEAFNHIFRSIRKDDYNCSSIVIPALFGVIFGVSRTVFISSLVICYILPLSILFGYLIKYITRNSNNSNFYAVCASIMCAFFPEAWAPTFRGYPGVSGLVALTITFIILVKNNFAVLKIKQAIYLGISIWLMFFFRRWYAYTVVATFAITPFLNYFIHNSQIERKKIVITLLNFTISGVTATLLALILQGGLVKRVITTSYADIYSGYQFGLSQSISSVVSHGGMAFIIITILLAIITLIKGDKFYRTFILSSLAILLISFFIFARTQTPGLQHCMPFDFLILIIFTLSLLCITQKFSNETRQKIIPTVAVIFIVSSFASTFYPSLNMGKIANKAFPVRVYPLRQTSYETYIQMCKDIVDLNANVAIFSSNGILNDDLIRNAMPAEHRNQIVGTSHVDLRDKINLTSYLADYVIVADPVQTHLHPESQYVVTIPAKSITNHEDIGKAYKVIKTYKLEHNVTATLYKKEFQISQEDIKQFLNKFFNVYPDWRNEYDNLLSQVILGMFNVRKGDIWGNIWLNKQEQILQTHPGENYSTKFSITNGLIKGLKITSTNTNCNLDDNIQLTITSGVQSNIYHLAHGAMLDISDLDINKSYSFELSKERSSGCDGVSLKFY